MSNTKNFIDKKSPKYVDLLDEDQIIAGQKFVCLSFVSPEKIIKQKELFYFNEFVKKYDINKSLEKFNGFMQFIAYKYKLNIEKISADMKEFIAEEKDTLDTMTLYDDFKTFVDTNEEKLDIDFNAKHNFQK